MFFNVGSGEVLVILLIALVVLGPDKLPDAMRQAGRWMGEIRKISDGFRAEVRSAMDDPLEAAARERGAKAVADSKSTATNTAADTTDSDESAAATPGPSQTAAQDPLDTGTSATTGGQNGVDRPSGNGAPTTGAANGVNPGNGIDPGGNTTPKVNKNTIAQANAVTAPTQPGSIPAPDVEEMRSMARAKQAVAAEQAADQELDAARAERPEPDNTTSRTEDSFNDDAEA